MADPKRVVERHVEAFNARDADADPWSDDAELVAPNASMRGRGEVLGFLGVFWDAFPDGRLETSRLLAEGSLVAAEGRFVGTHTGVMRTPAGDVAATGRHVHFRWMSSYEVPGGVRSGHDQQGNGRRRFRFEAKAVARPTISRALAADEHQH